MAQKTKLGILFGGQSVEHEISLLSAKNMNSFVDRQAYEVTLMGIDKQGYWYVSQSGNTEEVFNEIALPVEDVIPLIKKLDVVFPVLHGTDGEDGSMQGLFKILDTALVGSDVLGSALSMDKEVSKKILRANGIPVAQHLTIRNGDTRPSFDQVKPALGLPFFVKPANLGSSVGVVKVNDEATYDRAIEKAFLVDNKIVLEELITGREMECAVMGNDNPKASVPGEVIVNPKYSFYSYEAKYMDTSGASTVIPADVSEADIKNIKESCVKAYQALACKDYARVDLFLAPDGDVFINEINTLPGFTSISMFPMLWKHEGIAYTELVTNLINLALERFKKSKQISTQYTDAQ